MKQYRKLTYKNTYIMKKVLAVALLMFSMSLCAQNDVTKFLGIPVDGGKLEMMKKIKAKGYVSNPLEKDVLAGEFNGMDVNIHIVTNNNKVYRIMVTDKNTTDEANIRIRFNNLCKQFSNNKKYIQASLTDDYSISDEEDISYGIRVKNKRYEAIFYQLQSVVDSVAMAEEIHSILLSKYTKEELSNPTEELQKNMLVTSVSYLLEKYSKSPVWFMINELQGKYRIIMFYDNEYNRSNGDDL